MHCVHIFITTRAVFLMPPSHHFNSSGLVLCMCVVELCAGWRIASPSRLFTPHYNPEQTDCITKGILLRDSPAIRLSIQCVNSLEGQASWRMQYSLVYKLSSITGTGGLKNQGQRLTFYTACLAKSVSFGFNNFMAAITGDSLVVKYLIAFISPDIAHFTDRGT